MSIQALRGMLQFSIVYPGGSYINPEQL